MRGPPFMSLHRKYLTGGLPSQAHTFAKNGTIVLSVGYRQTLVSPEIKEKKTSRVT